MITFRSPPGFCGKARGFGLEVEEPRERVESSPCRLSQRWVNRALQETVRGALIYFSTFGGRLVAGEVGIFSEQGVLCLGFVDARAGSFSPRGIGATQGPGLVTLGRRSPPKARVVGWAELTACLPQFSRVPQLQFSSHRRLLTVVPPERRLRIRFQ
ncbi:uncharacterized protein LOC115836249 [Nomascus leucogenys]|uniref:uncharacterized protein LOC115836249 n=1 Tax=Nomascus leucogenys TaxID=61853 RepID=UPI00122D98C3|nr:uncharacterized protein LOC115836249 [Nomascus leucogenys]